MLKKLMLLAILGGLIAVGIKEYPAMQRELKIMRM